MDNLFFTSVLDRTYREALERLFYFNENQRKAHDAVSLAMERYGTPRIALINDRLGVTLESGVEAQSLFVMENAEPTSELVGMVV